MIRIGQIYESCRPTFVVDGAETYTWIKVIGHPRRRRVWVATLGEDGRERRARWLLATQLHTTDTTPAGQPRRTGYRLIQDAPEETPEPGHG